MTAPAFETVEVPSLCLRVQTDPVSLDEARLRSQDGRYTAVLAVPVSVLFGGASRSVVHAFLARSAVSGSSWSQVEYTPLALGEEGAVIFVEVTVRLRDEP